MGDCRGIHVADVRGEHQLRRDTKLLKLHYLLAGLDLKSYVNKIIVVFLLFECNVFRNRNH